MKKLRIYSSAVLAASLHVTLTTIEAVKKVVSLKPLH